MTRAFPPARSNPPVTELARPGRDPALVSNLADAYVAATNAGDADAVAALCEPDAVIWHNFDGAEVDLAASGRTLRWLHRRMPGITWADSRVTATTAGFVWQALLTGTADGTPVRVHTCSVVTVSPPGRVARVEEYLDPAAVAALWR